ncbi:MAG: tail fiber domain-containing protein, partial [Saprospiraceae bacterium]
GASNSMFGTSAGASTTSGLGNVFIGASSGENNETGGANTAIGIAASPTTAALNGSASIGAFAASNATNKMQLGNSTAVINTSNGYTIVSDGRFKEEVKNDIEGLEFIMNLKPVSYRFDYQKYDNFLRGEKGMKQLDETYKKQLAEKTQQREVGFIAQEVAEVADKMQLAFNGVYRPQHEKDNYALDYGRLSVPVVKAIQEQQAIIADKQIQIEELQAQITAQNTRLEKLEQLLLTGASGLHENQENEGLTPQLIQLTTPTLEQNQPNPFNGQTTIRYFLPESTQQAQIQITDINGKVLKVENIAHTGQGLLSLDAKTMPQGTYAYSLIVDGQLVETRQMILVK